MIILGIETSCDETGISLYDTNLGILTNKLFSQSLIHTKYGGIMPEIASKNHYKKIFIILKKSLKKSKKKIENIDIIAYSAGPGLPNSLLIGVALAKSISLIYNIPSIPINHIEAHIMSIMINKYKPSFPFISLVTSGAHTLLCIVKNYEKYKIIGQSLDDSAGEIFDKISILLKLKLPGGKYISKISKYSNKNLNFPKPLINKHNLNFSFSGLKTHIFNYIKNNKLNFNNKANIAFSLQESITTILVKKIKLASKKYKINNLSIVGGVSSNNTLRKKMYSLTKLNKKIFFNPKKLCTDNAAMIAYTGWIKYSSKKKIYNNLEIDIKSKWKINENF